LTIIVYWLTLKNAGVNFITLC